MSDTITIRTPDGIPWIDRDPTPVEVDRVVHAFMEVKHRPVMSRLARVRRHAKGGAL